MNLTDCDGAENTSGWNTEVQTRSSGDSSLAVGAGGNEVSPDLHQPRHQTLRSLKRDPGIDTLNATTESKSGNDGIARKPGSCHPVPRHCRRGNILLQVHNACPSNWSSSPLPRLVHADRHTPRHRAVREHRRYMGEAPKLLQRRRARESRMYTKLRRRLLIFILSLGRRGVRIARVNAFHTERRRLALPLRQPLSAPLFPQGVCPTVRRSTGLHHLQPSRARHGVLDVFFPFAAATLRQRAARETERTGWRRATPQSDTRGER